GAGGVIRVPAHRPMPLRPPPPPRRIRPLRHIPPASEPGSPRCQGWGWEMQTLPSLGWKAAGGLRRTD
ncbi:unnamed protein product, partial [Tetraodon nigroviridis]